MRTTGFWLPFLAIWLLALAGCSESDSTATGGATPETTPPEYPVTWRFALEEIEGSVQHAYAQALKQRIETHSDGKLEVEVFPYGSLGTSAQLTELVRNGSVDLAFASPGHLSDLVPEVSVFTLHYLLSDDASVNRELLASPELTSLLEQPYARQDLKLLDLVPEGWIAWTANKPLRSPADFEGLRIRTMTSSLAAASYQAYGATTSQTPYSQVYSDLQLNKIDAQSNPIFAIEEMAFYEVQSSLTMAQPAQFISSVVSNRAWYQQLPELQQQWLKNAIRDVSKIAWDAQTSLNQSRLERMLEQEEIALVQLSPEQRSAFRQASLPVRQVYLDRTGDAGREILDWVLNRVAELEKAQPASPAGDGG